jgi:hypothetical protein
VSCLDGIVRFLILDIDIIPITGPTAVFGVGNRSDEFDWGTILESQPIPGYEFVRGNIWSPDHDLVERVRPPRQMLSEVLPSTGIDVIDRKWPVTRSFQNQWVDAWVRCYRTHVPDQGGAYNRCCTVLQEPSAAFVYHRTTRSSTVHS